MTQLQIHSPTSSQHLPDRLRHHLTSRWSEDLAIGSFDAGAQAGSGDTDVTRARRKGGVDNKHWGMTLRATRLIARESWRRWRRDKLRALLRYQLIALP